MEAIKKCCTTHRGMFCHSCCSVMRSYGSVWGDKFHTNPVYSTDILLGLNPANMQAKVMSRGDAAKTANMCNMWSGTVMLKHSTVDIHVQNDLMLLDRVSVSDACKCIYHMHKGCPTWISAHSMTLPPTTKTVDLLHTVWNITLRVTSIDTWS